MMTSVSNYRLLIAAAGAMMIAAVAPSIAKAQCVDDGRVLSPCELLALAPRCDGDTDGNGIVEAADCAAVTTNLGSLDGEALCRYDLDCDGDIDVNDGNYCAGIATGACTGTRPCYVESMPFRVLGGQVSGAGASLFIDFFRFPASTNDWNDVDNDGFAGFDPLGPPFTDNLSQRFIPGNQNESWWTFQYRSVGSVNGYNEFVQNQLCDTIPTSIPAEAGIFNQFEYATGGVTNWGGPFGNASGTPFEPCGIDFSFLDVPSFYGTRVAGEPKWSRTPGDPGYGLNPVPSSSGYISNLQSLTRDCGSGPVSLNINLEAPDNSTMYDFGGAWVPVAYIANRGTNISDVKYTEMQHLFVTGRMPNGENLVGSTRSVGSGTRSAIMNSTGIDTSWGRGDNVGDEFAVTATANLGPGHQAVNCQGSSQIEQAVQMRRLAIGYTGLCGPSRAASDAQSGSYEVLNLCKDVIHACVGGANAGQPCPNGDASCPGGKCDYIPGCDCSAQACEAGPIDPITGLPVDAARPNNGYVRPGLTTVLDNCDACCGYQIGGIGSFITVGDPDANRDVADPLYEANPPVANQAVADYLNNIEDSIAAFSGSVINGQCNISGVSCTTDAQCPGAGDFCRLQLNMPGQLLAVQFFLPAGVDCVNVVSSGVDFEPTNPLNQVLQEYIRANNVGCNPPDFGTINPAGRVPLRRTLSGGAMYSDGRTDSNYLYWNGAAYVNINQGQRLALRNRVQGDANGDFVRDIHDAAGHVRALYTPRAWQTVALATGAGAGANLGNQTHDNAIPEVIFDHNGDGSLTKEDLRYFADGLALVGGALNRKQGAIAIDTEISALGRPYPWAFADDSHLIPAAASGLEPTFAAAPAISGFLATGAAYVAGDFRGDVAGNVSRAPIAGAEPVGYDGRVDADDIDYVCRNIGDWNDLNSAVFMDLSADMDGDLTVDSDDVRELVEGILKTGMSDVNLDGVEDGLDQAIVMNSIAGPNACIATATCGWADGDLNCDGVVDAADLSVFATSGACCDGTTCTEVEPGACVGYVCNVTALVGTTCLGDTDGNGVVNAADRGQISANIGGSSNAQLCLFDLDGNGSINAADRGQVSANIGLCTALPGYMNGAGPDSRFPQPSFLGSGTTCAPNPCD